jgi:hypothetical protein
MDYSDYLGSTGDLIAVFSSFRKETDVINTKLGRVALVFARKLKVFITMQEYLLCDNQVFLYSQKAGRFEHTLTLDINVLTAIVMYDNMILGTDFQTKI